MPKHVQNYLSFKSKLTELSPWHRKGIVLLVLISVLNGLPQRKTVLSNSTYRYMHGSGCIISSEYLMHFNKHLMLTRASSAVLGYQIPWCSIAYLEIPNP